MYKVAICDDNCACCSRIEQLVKDNTKSSGEDFEIEVFHGGPEFYKHLHNGARYDLIFLDIDMPGIDGREIGKTIRKDLKDNDVDIIYISAHAFYALELFENRPFDFLIKPISLRTMEQEMKKYMEVKRKCDYNFQFVGGKRVYMKDILFFTIRGHVVEVMTTAGEMSYYGKLADVYDDLKEQRFFYINKSQVVNYNRVKEFYYNTLVMEDGTSLSIAQRKRKQVAELQRAFSNTRMRL